MSYLRELRQGISSADIPLLAPYFEHPAPNTRLILFDLLAHLPESDFVIEMSQRVPEAVSLTGRLFGNKIRVDMQALNELRKEIGLKSTAAFFGDQPELLAVLIGDDLDDKQIFDRLDSSDLISYVPISRWLSHFNCSVADLWSLVQSQGRNTRQLLGSGITESLSRTGTAEEIRTWLSLVPAQMADSYLKQLKSKLSPADVGWVVSQRFERELTLSIDGLPHKLLGDFRGTYTTDLTHQIINAWVADLKSKGLKQSSTPYTRIADYGDPFDRDAIVERLEKEIVDLMPKHYDHMPEYVYERLSFRAEMHRAFNHQNKEQTLNE